MSESAVHDKNDPVLYACLGAMVGALWIIVFQLNEIIEKL